MAAPYVFLSRFVAFKLFKCVMSTPGLLSMFAIVYGVISAIIAIVFVVWLSGLWLTRCGRISRDQRERERIHSDDRTQADDALETRSGIALFQPSPSESNLQEPGQARAQIHNHSSNLPKQHEGKTRPKVTFQHTNGDGQHSASHVNQRTHQKQSSIEMPLTPTTLQMVTGLADNVVTDVDPVTMLSESSGTNNSSSLKRVKSYRGKVKTKNVIARELEAAKRNLDGGENREQLQNGPKGMDTGTPSEKLTEGSKQATVGREGGKTKHDTAAGDYTSLSKRNTGDNYASLGIAPDPPNISQDAPQDVSKKTALSILSPDMHSPKKPEEPKTHLPLKRLLPPTPPQQEEQDRRKYKNEPDEVYQEIKDHEMSGLKEGDLQSGTGGYMKFIHTSDFVNTSDGNSDYARIADSHKDNDDYLVPTPH